MCGVCGCGSDEVRIEKHGHDASGHHHSHGQHDHGHDLAAGSHAAGRHHQREHIEGKPTPGGSTESRLVEIERSILSKNQLFADENRQRFGKLGLLVLNLTSSPGAGKTSLLVETLTSLREDVPLWVIEGDQETSNDADRIRQTGVPAIQINTGRGCHLDAHSVGHAAEHLPLAAHGILFIENVGNLVCPAGFDLGEGKRVVILSVTEGDDKPIKYPDAFAAADLMILSKIDLLPHVDFDPRAAIEMARRVNPDIEVLQLSTRNGEGMPQWLGWLKAERRKLIEAEAAALEAQLLQARRQLAASA